MRYSSDAPVLQDTEYNEHSSVNGYNSNDYTVNGYDKGCDDNDCMSDVDGDGGGPRAVPKQQKACDPEGQGTKTGWGDVEM